MPEENIVDKKGQNGASPTRPVTQPKERKFDPDAELSRYVDMRRAAVQAATVFRGYKDERGRTCLDCTLVLSYGIAKGTFVRLNDQKATSENRATEWPVWLNFIEPNLVHDQCVNRLEPPRLTGPGGQLYLENVTIWPHAAPDKPYRVARLMIFTTSIEGITFDEFSGLGEVNV